MENINFRKKIKKNSRFFIIGKQNPGGFFKYTK